MPKARETIKVAVGGFGAIGRRVALALDAGLPGLQLVAVAANNVARAEQEIARRFEKRVPVLALEELADVADVVVECAPAELVTRVAEPVLTKGKTLVLISVGALQSAPHLVLLATENGGRILVPSGALLGLDAVQAAALGHISSVRMVTRKPVRGLQGAPYLVERKISLADITQPLQVFEGSAAEAIRGFPANVNVAVALGLAGIGPERTQLQIWAEPLLERNIHSIEVVADSATFRMQIENVPSDDNPKTGKIVALSVLATLRKLTAPLVIGA
jgi:aspartate dehydrogenase